MISDNFIKMVNSVNFVFVFFARLVKLLGDFGEDIATKTPRIVNRKNFAIGGVKTTVAEFNGFSVKVKQDNLKNVLQIGGGNLPNSNDDVLASLFIPSSVRELLPKNKMVDIVTVTYNQDDLFITKTNHTGIVEKIIFAVLTKYIYLSVRSIHEIVTLL